MECFLLIRKQGRWVKMSKTQMSLGLRERINYYYSWFQTFAVIWILYIFFWVFPRRQIVVGRRFGTLYQFHLQRLSVQCTLYTQPLKMELIQGSETSANYNLTPGKYPEENIQIIINNQDNITIWRNSTDHRGYLGDARGANTAPLNIFSTEE